MIHESRVFDDNDGTFSSRTSTVLSNCNMVVGFPTATVHGLRTVITSVRCPPGVVCPETLLGL